MFFKISNVYGKQEWFVRAKTVKSAYDKLAKRTRREVLQYESEAAFAVLATKKTKMTMTATPIEVI